MEKNILIIIDKISNGGAQRAAVNLSNALSKYYKVTFVAFEMKEKSYECNCEIINLNCGESNNKIKKIVNILKRIHKIRRIKRENNITHSISFLTMPNFINTYTKVNEKTIISIRNEMSKLENNIIEKTLNKMACKKADVVVPVSKYVGYDQQINYNVDENKMKVIYNFCDKNYIDIKKQEELDLDLLEKIKDSKLILSIGRLESQKGQWHLIRAFKKVVEEIPNTKLLILGKGSLKEYFNKLINQLNLENNIYIIDFDTNPYKYINKADIFVLPSLYEGMPNVVLEAMACGLPIISADCNAGPREILAPNTNIQNRALKVEYEEYGILTPPLDNILYNANDELTNSENFLKEAILKLLKDKNIRKEYSNKSLERISYFDKERILKEWIDLLEK